MEISQPDLSPKSSTEHRRPAHGAASKMSVQEMIECADDVKNECDLGNVQDVNKCDDGAMNDCDVVVRDACMENVSLPEKSVKSDKIKRKDPHSVSSLKSTNETRPKCRVKYRVVNSSGGKFSISAAKGDPDSQEKSEVKTEKKLSTVKANLEFFKNLENSLTQPISNSTSTNNMTPGKRKLAPVVEGTWTPVCISDEKISIFTPGGNSYESPTKKQRGVRRVHGHIN